MFKKYSKSHNGEILEPKHIRNSLQQLNFGTIKELDFIEGNMGCAQETLEMILGYLHREYVCPNYLEGWVSSNKDVKF